MDSQDTSSPGDLVDPASPIQDFGCYITIKNDSKRDLLLDTFGIIGQWGEWPIGQPVNTIKAWTSETVHLSDKAGPGGSEGWVEYEVRVNRQTERFRIDFDCPQLAWSNNKVKYSRSTDAILVDVGWYGAKGHPLRCTVSVTLREEASITNDLISTATDQTAVDDNDTVRANFEIGFKAPLGVFKSTPIHECIGIAAFINSNFEPPFAKGTIPNNLSADQWEFFRGVIWPDDPRCLLFNDRQHNNRDYGKGLEWLEEFKFGEPWTMTRRSHFGDLQFLHSMGSAVGEKPEVTREKLLMWMGVMYRLSLGQDDVSENDSVTKHLPESLFPRSEWTSVSLRTLLVASTPSYRLTDIRRRALGVCLHIIQDSYAVSHTKRHLRNPEDLLSRDGNGYMHFQPGTHGDWGDVLCFHTYVGQSEWRHKHYDSMPQGYGEPSPRDLSTFDPIIGARSAIEGCRILIDFFVDNTPWRKVKAELEGSVFKLHPDAFPSDSDVDSQMLIPQMLIPQMLIPPVESVTEGNRNNDVEYWAGHERKLLALGVSGDGLTSSSLRFGDRIAPYNIRSVCVLTLAVVLGFVAAASLFKMF
ncbi:hypothetical protein V2G26_018327 [Clonostachys chloroleuca]